MTTNVLTAVITAYCSCKLCCGPNAKGITANGQKAKAEVTIAASRSIPFNSTVIVGNKSYIVQDRLARRYDSRFDIYMSSHQSALNFGIRTQQVTIITKAKQ